VTAFSEYDPELVAAVEEAFLGHWEPDVANIVGRPYEPGVLRELARQLGVDEAVD
jgi:hypothetical protein